MNTFIVFLAPKLFLFHLGWSWMEPPLADAAAYKKTETCLSFIDRHELLRARTDKNNGTENSEHVRCGQPKVELDNIMRFRHVATLFAGPFLSTVLTQHDNVWIWAFARFAQPILFWGNGGKLKRLRWVEDGWKKN